MLGWVAAVVSGDLERIASIGGGGRNRSCRPKMTSTSARHSHAVAFANVQRTGNTPLAASPDDFMLPPEPSFVINFALTTQTRHPRDLIASVDALIGCRRIGVR